MEGIESGMEMFRRVIDLESLVFKDLAVLTSAFTLLHFAV